MLLLTKKELNPHQDATECYIYRKKTVKKLAKDKNHRSVRDHCHFTGKHRTAAHSILNLRFNVPNEVCVAFNNGSDYGYHFTIKSY